MQSPNALEKGQHLHLFSFVPAVALTLTSASLVPVAVRAAQPAIPRAKATTTSVPDGSVTHSGRKRHHLAAPVSASAPSSDAGGYATSTRQQTHLAVRILLDEINTGRAVHGLAPVTLNRRLSACSRLHSRHMALAGAISHDQFQADVCIPHRYAGENVGVDAQPPDGAVVQLHELMMNEGPCAQSDCRGAAYERHGHYLNILNPRYKYLGIGIVVKNGETWLTEDFTS